MRCFCLKFCLLLTHFILINDMQGFNCQEKLPASALGTQNLLGTGIVFLEVNKEKVNGTKVPIREYKYIFLDEVNSDDTDRKLFQDIHQKYKCTDSNLPSYKDIFKQGLKVWEEASKCNQNSKPWLSITQAKRIVDLDGASRKKLPRDSVDRKKDTCYDDDLCVRVAFCSNKSVDKEVFMSVIGPDIWDEAMSEATMILTAFSVYKAHKKENHTKKEEANRLEELAIIVAHEWGHVFGLEHEHRHPNSKINPQAHILGCLKEYNNDKGFCDRVYGKVDKNYTTERYDTKSIMHYNFDATETTDHKPIEMNMFLSETDKKFMRKTLAVCNE